MDFKELEKFVQWQHLIRTEAHNNKVSSTGIFFIFIFFVVRLTKEKVTANYKSSYS